MRRGDQRQAPYFEALQSYVRQQNLTFHVPGHQHGRSAPQEFTELLHSWGLACDITEVWGIDDIHDPVDQYDRARDLAAQLHGADQTFFLVNGSTVGNQAMFLSVLGPESSVILPHNSHRSVYSALLLSGASAHFFATDFHPELLCSLPPTLQQAVEAMDCYPQASAFFLTSPTYHGATSPLPDIVAEAHKRGLVVMVDEAWGGHLKFCQGLPTALEAGADLVVQSAHKMTSALTQGAFLHLRGSRVDPSRVASVLRHLQTSSPSSLLVASLDCARRQMALEGEALWTEALRLATSLQRRIQSLEGIDCFQTPPAWDASRLLVRAHGYSGARLEEVLRKQFRIQVEMSELHQVLFLITPGHTPEHADRLVDALGALPPAEESFDWKEIRDTLLALWSKNRLWGPPEKTVREVFFSTASPVNLEEAVDQTCAELLYCYPPGVPFVYPGQRFSREALELIKMGRRLGGSVKGGADPSLDSVLVLNKE